MTERSRNARRAQRSDGDARERFWGISTRCEPFFSSQSKDPYFIQSKSQYYNNSENYSESLHHSYQNRREIRRIDFLQVGRARCENQSSQRDLYINKSNLIIEMTSPSRVSHILQDQNSFHKTKIDISHILQYPLWTWTYGTSFFFAFTLYSTVGYGIPWFLLLIQPSF